MLNRPIILIGNFMPSHHTWEETLEEKFGTFGDGGLGSKSEMRSFIIKVESDAYERGKAESGKTHYREQIEKQAIARTVQEIYAMRMECQIEDAMYAQIIPQESVEAYARQDNTTLPLTIQLYERINKKQISEILVKWDMPTRQIAINEIMKVFNTILADKKSKVENKVKVNDRLGKELNFENALTACGIQGYNKALSDVLSILNE